VRLSPALAIPIQNGFQPPAAKTLFFKKSPATLGGTLKNCT
jgi:hypothetical protein